MHAQFVQIWPKIAQTDWCDVAAFTFAIAIFSSSYNFLAQLAELIVQPVKSCLCVSVDQPSDTPPEKNSHEIPLPRNFSRRIFSRTIPHCRLRVTAGAACVQRTL